MDKTCPSRLNGFDTMVVRLSFLYELAVEKYLIRYETYLLLIIQARGNIQTSSLKALFSTKSCTINSSSIVLLNDIRLAADDGEVTCSCPSTFKLSNGEKS